MSQRRKSVRRNRRRKPQSQGEEPSGGASEQEMYDAILKAILQSPPDGLFKGTFQSAENAASLLHSALAPTLRHRIDWSSLEAVPTEQLGQWLDDRYGDVLFRARLVEGAPDGDEAASAPLRWVYIDVMLEHQSKSIALMNLRILGMLVRRYESLVRNTPEGIERLPLVLPVVLFQGESGRGWHHAVQFSETLDCSAETLEAFRPYVPDFRFVLDDISQQSIDELYARKLTDVALVTLRLLRDARDNPHLLEALENPRDLATWRRIATLPNGTMVYQSIWLYLYSVLDATPDRIHDFARTLGPPIKEHDMTAAQQLIARGKTEGKAEGKAETLKQLLALKFGDPAASVFARVDRGSLEELSRWTARILSANSVDDVFE